jgi:hypothetical protein
MPENYSKIELGQLITGIVSKYLSLKSEDVATQKKLLEKDKEIFKFEKEVQYWKIKVGETKLKKDVSGDKEEFQILLDSGELEAFIEAKDIILNFHCIERNHAPSVTSAVAFGLTDNLDYHAVRPSIKNGQFLKWLILEKSAQKTLKKP